MGTDNKELVSGTTEQTGDAVDTITKERDIDRPPSHYPSRGTVTEFKSNAAFGIKSVERFSTLTTVTVSDDDSGTKVYQFLDIGSCSYSRYSATDSAWTEFAKAVPVPTQTATTEPVVVKRKMALSINRTELPEYLSGNHVERRTMRVPDLFFWTDAFLMDRAVCESNDDTVQLLPYIVIRAPNGDVLTYARGDGGEESRLHGALSIGVGGHVDTEVPAYFGGNMETHLKLEAMREIMEEIGVRVVPERIKFSTLLYDRSNPVGMVHLGIAAQVFLTEQEVASIKPEANMIENFRFSPVSLVQNDQRDRLENWSCMLVTEDYFF